MRKNNGLLRSARMDRQWTVEFVSEQVGVKISTYIRWEEGIQVPRHTSLRALCRIFSMSVSELGFLDSPDASSSQEHVKRAEVDGVCGHGGVSAGVQSQAVDEEQEPDTSSQEDVQATETDVSPKLDVLAEELALCWEQFVAGEQVKLEILIPKYLARLHRPTLAPGPDQRLAASLMSQVYQLMAMLELQHGNTAGARRSGTQAIVYGQLARDWNVCVAAQVRLATILSACKRPGAALEAYNDALRLINTYNDAISATLHSKVFAGLAEIQATMGREQEARQLLKLALAIFPAHPENDLCFPYTRYDFSMLYLYEGIVFLRLGLVKHAWDAFSLVDTLKPPPNERTRAEFLKYRAYTSLLLGNMTQCCIYLEAAARAAQEISSDLVFGEVYAIYEHVLAIWGQEPRVRLLARLFQK
jgi:transcriptional regulator with XRE-family HTH domain/tetratricopeptide (TPR) repeat protein